MRYHKELPSFQEVRTFLDKYTAKIVSILLYGLNMGDIDMAQKDNVKSCLESVIELVTNDLKQACEDDAVCQTFPALANIFCKVDGYTENDQLAMRKKFVDEQEGFDRFGHYLLNKAASRLGDSDSINDTDVTTNLCPISGLPSFESILTILTMVNTNYSWMKDKVIVARAAMFYLLSMVSFTSNYLHEHMDLICDVLLLRKTNI
jgi:hypothetical protein